MLEEEAPLPRDIPHPRHHAAKALVAMRLLPHGMRVVDDEDGGVVLDAKPVGER